MLKTADINIRDPFIVTVPEEGCYYLYGTRGPECWQGAENGLDVYRSTDLENWEAPAVAFKPSPDFWGKENFWAPEVHHYQGKYYMFASFKSADRCRGTHILASEGPMGPFRPVSDRPVTPEEWECLDGTLYVDQEGNPWIVFCHEWVQVKDGEICALRLSKDLKQAVGEPVLLFTASQAGWCTHLMAGTEQEQKGCYVTDGPFFYRTDKGELLLLWSSFQGDQYAIGVTHSASGDIKGPWIHEPKPLYGRDGGHGMIFRTLEGQLVLTIHTPNIALKERPVFIPLQERDGRLEIK